MKEAEWVITHISLESSNKESKDNLTARSEAGDGETDSVNDVDISTHSAKKDLKMCLQFLGFRLLCKM